MLPICTWPVLMGQVLTLGVDTMNLLLSFVCCTSSQGRFKRSQGTVSATGKMSLIYALDILMKTCRVSSKYLGHKSRTSFSSSTERARKAD